MLPKTCCSLPNGRPRNLTVNPRLHLLDGAQLYLPFDNSMFMINQDCTRCACQCLFHEMPLSLGTQPPTKTSFPLRTRVADLRFHCRMFSRAEVSTFLPEASNTGLAPLLMTPKASENS